MVTMLPLSMTSCDCVGASSADRSRAAADSGDLHVLHQQASGAAGAAEQPRGPRGRAQPAALRGAGHLQQTLSGSPLRWSVRLLFHAVRYSVKDTAFSFLANIRGDSGTGGR